jgi:hypothetical protein
MFVIADADPSAIRALLNEEGELSAAIELRRRFPGLSGQREGAGLREDHGRLDAAAGAVGHSDAAGHPKERLKPGFGDQRHRRCPLGIRGHPILCTRRAASRSPITRSVPSCAMQLDRH